jgi:hypothetical protein
MKAKFSAFGQFCDLLPGVRVDLLDKSGELLERGVHPGVDLNFVLGSRTCAGKREIQVKKFT